MSRKKVMPSAMYFTESRRSLSLIRRTCSLAASGSLMVVLTVALLRLWMVLFCCSREMSHQARAATMYKSRTQKTMVARLNCFLVWSTILPPFFLYAEAYVEHMLQGVFAHDLFEGKGIITRLLKIEVLVDRRKRYAVFVEVVHTAAEPSLFGRGQGQLVLCLG